MDAAIWPRVVLQAMRGTETTLASLPDRDSSVYGSDRAQAAAAPGRGESIVLIVESALSYLRRSVSGYLDGRFDPRLCEKRF